MLRIETSTSLGSVPMFEGVAGQFKGALRGLLAPINFKPSLLGGGQEEASIVPDHKG